MASLMLIKSMLFANALQNNKQKNKRKVKRSCAVQQSIKKINNMCRICNEEKGEIPIFDNFVQPNIPEEIQHFANVTINRSDHWSKNMCQSCLDLLNGCIMFREMCQRSNKMLEVSIKKELNPDCIEYRSKLGMSEDSDDSYDVPSPTFSDDMSGIWDCSSCNKQFYDTKSYDSHTTRCINETTGCDIKPPKDMTKKKFLCDICGKTTSSNASLLVHMYVAGTHENIFPFKCDVCPYQGRTMDLLKVHKRTHLVDKPFKCTQCPKATTTSSNLAKHMRHVHSTARPHKCNYCEKAFSYQHDMKRHIKDIHLRQGTVECNVCYKKFNTKKILQGHRWKIHKLKGERQGRQPSYLQHQMEGQEHPENVNECNTNY